MDAFQDRRGNCAPPRIRFRLHAASRPHPGPVEPATVDRGGAQHAQVLCRGCERHPAGGVRQKAPWSVPATSRSCTTEKLLTSLSAGVSSASRTSRSPRRRSAQQPLCAVDPEFAVEPPDRRDGDAHATSGSMLVTREGNSTSSSLGRPGRKWCSQVWRGAALRGEAVIERAIERLHRMPVSIEANNAEILDRRSQKTACRDAKVIDRRAAAEDASRAKGVRVLPSKSCTPDRRCLRAPDGRSRQGAGDGVLQARCARREHFLAGSAVRRRRRPLLASLT